MPRYFIEVAYKGARYSGFQIQQNATTIQSEVERALAICFKQSFLLTGASRTDAGVHAMQNYFHFDIEGLPVEDPRKLYNLNAILPPDIVVKRIIRKDREAHCRFDAISREYRYYIYRDKNPFMQDRAFYYPFKLDGTLLNDAAAILMKHSDFTSFSKKNTQVKNFQCTIYKSLWIAEENQLIYNVTANRFLRGMVKGLVGTMLLVGTKKISLSGFENIIIGKDASRASFAVPPHGLFLVKVNYS